MSVLWPRIPLKEARSLFDELESGARAIPAERHPQQTYAQVGGRVAESEVQQLHQRLAGMAALNGYPSRRPIDGVAFDRAVTQILREGMDLTWAEAASREVWHFTALVAFADITEWRWSDQKSRNIERWVASDLTRHTWGRLWWRATAFEEQPGLLDRLSESELNQLLERRIIGSNPLLLVALAESVLKATDSGVPRREIIRDATKRVRRALSFINDLVLDPVQVRELTDRLVYDSVRSLSGGH